MILRIPSYTLLQWMSIVVTSWPDHGRSSWPDHYGSLFQSQRFRDDSWVGRATLRTQPVCQPIWWQLASLSSVTAFPSFTFDRGCHVLELVSMFVHSIIQSQSIQVHLFNWDQPMLMLVIRWPCQWLKYSLNKPCSRAWILLMNDRRFWSLKNSFDRV